MFEVYKRFFEITKTKKERKNQICRSAMRENLAKFQLSLSFIFDDYELIKRDIELSGIYVA